MLDYADPDWARTFLRAVRGDIASLADCRAVFPKVSPGDDDADCREAERLRESGGCDCWCHRD